MKKLRSIFKKIDSARLVARCNRFALLLHAAGSVLLCFVIEALSRHSVVEVARFFARSPLVFFYNALIIFVTLSVAFLFRRRFFVRTIVTLAWLILGITNCVILTYRVTPFTGPDFAIIGDAIKIIRRYMSVFGIIMVIALLAFVLFLMVLLFFRAPKYKGRRRVGIDVLVVALSFALFFGATALAHKTRLISGYFGNIAFAYHDYGFSYCFGVTLLDTGISQPEGYSEKLVDRIAARDEAEETDGAKQRPNLIFVQLESFMDPKQVSFLSISEDPIPNFRALQKEYSSGNLRVPVVGAGTVNTEFETITGMSLRYFGAGEYPYKTVLEERTCESMPYVLADEGYRSHVVHNNEATFYDRNKVFPKLGFEDFISSEYMTNTGTPNEMGWLSDRILTDEILQVLNATSERDYIYAISVQGHGDYPSEPVIKNPPIDVHGARGREQNNDSWEYYCKQLREMDEFVSELVEALENYPEPTIAVFYGDHLPTMGLTARELKNRFLFQTPYLIYDNFGMEKEDMDLATYQLGAEILDRLDIHEGNLVKYHQARKGTRNYQIDLEILQYDMLYGEQYIYGGSSPYKETDMRMGILPISLTSIADQGEGSYMLYGENFTKSSRAEIDGELIDDTVFISPTRLYLPEAGIAPDSVIDIAQTSSAQEKEVLSRTEEQPVRALLEQSH